MVEFEYLTPEQCTHFLERGWVSIPGGIPPANVDKFISNVWVRLGYSPTDKSTWVSEKLHMPRHREMPHKDYMPDAYKAICELHVRIEMGEIILNIQAPLHAMICQAILWEARRESIRRCSPNLEIVSFAILARNTGLT